MKLSTKHRPLDVWPKFLAPDAAARHALNLEASLGRDFLAAQPAVNRLARHSKRIRKRVLTAENRAGLQEGIGIAHAVKSTAFLDSLQPLLCMPADADRWGMADDLEIGKKIREKLAATGRTQAELARHMGVTRQSVQSWLTTGTIAKPKVAQICAFFGMPLSWLMGEDAFDDETMSFAREFSALDQHERRRWMIALMNIRSKRA